MFVFGGAMQNHAEVYDKKTSTLSADADKVLCDFMAEREALESMLSRNIIKLQITDNHILSKAQSKSKSF